MEIRNQMKLQQDLLSKKFIKNAFYRLLNLPVEAEDDLPNDEIEFDSDHIMGIISTSKSHLHVTYTLTDIFVF